MKKAKIATRKLKETSWLAQTLVDKMEIEFSENGESAKWRAFKFLKYIVSCADTGEWEMRYENIEKYNAGLIRQIIIPTIPYGMQSEFLGMQARYEDVISVLVTHDLNSATIKDISRLMDAMRLS
ncbi:MAG TPA: hypothetical protein PKM21_18855 [Anaerolineales bacterium]|nr:hypothetical protein [Anaerolineales bacterium]